LAKIVDRQDVGVGEGRDRFRLALEARQSGWVLCKICGKDLDGDFTIELRVPSPVNFTHTARADGR
jgi:hypothetical protein